MNNFLKISEVVMLMVCLFAIIVALISFVDGEMKLSLNKSSKKDKCISIGMKYQGDYDAPGHGLCYGVNPEGRLIYKEIN